MDKAELKSTLKRMVVEECDKDMPPADIRDDEQLIGGRLDLDSLDALQISMWVQKNYGVRIENGPPARKALRSIDSLADFIASQDSESALSAAE